MYYIIKIFFALILFFPLNLVAEEISNFKNPEKPYDKSELKSGSYYSREETRAIEQDEFENPGMIWVERGSELFSVNLGENNISCSNCHNKNNNSLISAATTYPKIYENKF